MKSNNRCTDTTKRARGNIYRKAAALVATNREHYSCSAIEKVMGNEYAWPPHTATQDYVEAVLCANRYSWKDGYDLTRDDRVIALCLMAAMVEAGDA